MKRFFNNQYVSNIIIGILFLILSNVIPLIKSRIKNESFAKEFKLFWTYKIDLWIYVLTIFLLIMIFTIYNVLKKKNFKYDTETIKIDRRLFQKIQKELLHQEGAIYWLRTQHFGSAFLDKYVVPLTNFEHECFKSDFEFLNPELESLKKEMFDSVKKFNETLTANTFGHGKNCQTVPPEWRYEQKERYEIAVRELNRLAEEICKNYDNFIRKGRKILKV